MEIDYFEMPEMPGKKVFRCEKRRATITCEACAKMWRGASEKITAERFWLCKGCQIGAQHAGVGNATLSPLFGAPICARCQRGATRLIHGHICVSCANRQYEYRKGKNARGNTPVTHPHLYRISIRYQTDGRTKTVARPDSASLTELVVAALRDEPKQVTFCMSPPMRSPLPQMELFA